MKNIRKITHPTPGFTKSLFSSSISSFSTSTCRKYPETPANNHSKGPYTKHNSTTSPDLGSLLISISSETSNPPRTTKPPETNDHQLSNLEISPSSAKKSSILSVVNRKRTLGYKHKTYDPTTRLHIQKREEILANEEIRDEDSDTADWVTEIRPRKKDGELLQEQVLSKLVVETLEKWDSGTEQLKNLPDEFFVKAIQLRPYFLNFLNLPLLIKVINRISQIESHTLTLNQYCSIFYALCIHAPFTPNYNFDNDFPSSQLPRLPLPGIKYNSIRTWPILQPTSQITPEEIPPLALTLFKSLKSNGITPNAQIYSYMFQIFKDDPKELAVLQTYVSKVVNTISPMVRKTPQTEEMRANARKFCTEESTLALLAAFSRGKSRHYAIADRVVKIWWQYLHLYGTSIHDLSPKLCIAVLEVCTVAAKHIRNSQSEEVGEEENENVVQLGEVEGVIGEIHIRLRQMGLFKSQVSTVGVQWGSEDESKTGPNIIMPIETVRLAFDRLIEAYSACGGYGIKGQDSYYQKNLKMNVFGDGWCTMVLELMDAKRKHFLQVSDKNRKAALYVLSDFPPGRVITLHDENNVKRLRKIVSLCSYLTRYDDESIRIWSNALVFLRDYHGMRKCATTVQNQLSIHYREMYQKCIELYANQTAHVEKTKLKRASEFSVVALKDTEYMEDVEPLPLYKKTVSIHGYEALLDAHARFTVAEDDYLRTAYNDTIQCRRLFEVMVEQIECGNVILQDYNVRSNRNLRLYRPTYESLANVMMVFGKALKSSTLEAKRFFAKFVLQYGDFDNLVVEKQLKRRFRFEILGSAELLEIMGSPEEFSVDASQQNSDYSIDILPDHQLSRLRYIWTDIINERVKPVFERLYIARKRQLDLEAVALKRHVKKFSLRRNSNLTQSGKEVQPIRQKKSKFFRMTKRRRAEHLNRLKKTVRFNLKALKDEFGVEMDLKDLKSADLRDYNLGAVLFNSLIKKQLCGVGGPLGKVYDAFVMGWGKGLSIIKQSTEVKSPSKAGWEMELNMELDSVMKELEEMEKKAVLHLLVTEFGGKKEGALLLDDTEQTDPIEKKLSQEKSEGENDEEDWTSTFVDDE